VQDAVNNVEPYLKKKEENVMTKAPVPFKNGYRPEVDITEDMGKMKHRTTTFSNWSIAIWIVGLGRDINTKVSIIPSHLVLPQGGHLEQVFRIIAYLKKAQLRNSV